MKATFTPEGKPECPKCGAAEWEGCWWGMLNAIVACMKCNIVYDYSMARETLTLNEGATEVLLRQESHHIGGMTE